LSICAQNNYNLKGIKFEQDLDWQQIKDKAQKYNKYIFVDCYATWCGPCKKMDKDVYPNEQVGRAFNDKFLSVKVQMDSSKNDSQNIKMLYPAAREIEEKYNVTGLPTYLFFSPEGVALHKAMGSKSTDELIALANDAINPDKQLYTLIRNFRLGKLSHSNMPTLAIILKQLGEDSLAREIATYYIQAYLYTLNNDSLCKKENLEFFHAFERIITSKDRIFKLYVEQSEKIDAIMETNGYSKFRIISTITSEDIQPFVKDAAEKKTTPNWERIRATINNKYNNDYAITATSSAKQRWYIEKKDWQNYTDSLMELWMRKSGEFYTYSWMYLNDIAWKVCVYSNNKKKLKAGLEWINIAISKNTTSNIAMLDTKAQLKYKLGHKKKAIELERQVVQLAKAEYQNIKERQSIIDYFQDCLNRMIKGEPIVLTD